VRSSCAPDGRKATAIRRPSQRLDGRGGNWSKSAVNDAPPEPESTTESRAAEAAAIRRRWITLGEVLAVIAVIISGLTLWSNWSERRESEVEKSADTRKASIQAATLVLTATASGERELVLRPASAAQSVQSQIIAFPTALGAPPAETTGEPRIEAAWFERALKKAREAADLPDNSRGDERLPVAITTRFLVDGRAHEDVALYDIGYTISGRLISGHSVTLRGLSLVDRVSEDRAQAKLDARWKALFPAK
jgi:hypothetical protein